MIRPLVLILFACSTLLLDGQSASTCHFVSSDRITGRDLAAAVPQMALIPSDLNLGYSPAPGAMRIFRTAQLQQLASKWGINAGTLTPVCFAWSLRTLSRQDITAAILKSLAGQEAELEITEQSRSPVPDGELIFPIQGLSSESAKPAVWNGYVLYAGSRKFCTWAQVRITVHEKQVIAARPISAGEMIDLSALKQVDYVGPLRRSAVLETKEQAAGKCTRWAITAGTILKESMLSLPLDVEKDHLVTVHISCGGAHIETQGIAGDSGYIGNVIRVRNPKTGRVFRAKIDDHGVVTVVAGGDVGLVVEDRKS